MMIEPVDIITPPPQQQQQPRFEDLTIDDDLPLLPRIQRYVQSSIALQRLVHVRMLGEVSLDIGRQSSATELVPLLSPLVRDGESIIRQRLCGELKIICLVLMGMTGGSNSTKGGGAMDDTTVNDFSPTSITTTATTTKSSIMSSLPQISKPNKNSKYYKVMVHHVLPHLYTLISDSDNEVRREASENIVKLALRIDVDDVVPLILSIPLRLVKEGQKRATSGSSTTTTSSSSASAPPQQQSNGGIEVAENNGGGGGGGGGSGGMINPQTPAEDLLITSSNLLADLSSFLPPPRLSPDVATRYLSPAILALAEDANFRVRRAAVQAIPRMLGSATIDDVKRRLLPKFVTLSGDEMYRVRKASGECLVDVSRAIAILPWRIHFRDVWIDDQNNNGGGESAMPEFYKHRTKEQIDDLLKIIIECHGIRRRVLCGIAKKLLEDSNKFVRYGMLQFLGPLIASFYPLDRGSTIGSMGGLMYSGGSNRSGNNAKVDNNFGTLGIGVESVHIAKASTGLERMDMAMGSSTGGLGGVFSYNHSLHGLELILHGESPLNRDVLKLGGGCNANKDPFGTMGPQFFPHANGMVGRSSVLDDDDTDTFLVKSYLKANIPRQVENMNDPSSLQSSPRSLLPKFLLESRSDALALARIVCHRAGVVPGSSSGALYSPLLSGRPDLDDLKSISNTLLNAFIGMASYQTGEESTDAEMRVYCAYSLPAVILLFGENNWETGGLKRCFLDLIGRPNDMYADSNDSPQAAVGQPPLPVKRCLASSVHAVAHMLGPDVVSKDVAFLSAFEESFLCDPDEAIRLNVLKNLASFLSALPPGDGPGHRNSYIPMLHSLIMGDDVLGASKRRSASNPGVLNWRQRDAVAKMLPDLIVLYSSSLNRNYIWPILKTLLTDSVSAVRENAGWSVPVLLRKYTSNKQKGTVWIAEVTDWLQDTFLDEGCNGNVAGGRTSRGLGSFARRLKKQMTSSEGAYSRRQSYCRILAAVALATRISEGGDECDDSQVTKGVPIDPFGRLSPYERGQLRSILVRDLLPPALAMAQDCVANVRLTLTKCLKVLPSDIRMESNVEDVLSTLEEELMTWDYDMIPNQGEIVANE